MVEMEMGSVLVGEELNLDGMDFSFEGGSCSENSFIFKRREPNDAIYTELWHACAGPLVSIPRIGEKIFYFPQGHLDQIQACTNQQGHFQLPTYDLPYKILCRVVYVHLKADPVTDEVYTQVTLLPATKPDDHNLDKQIFPSQPQRTRAYSFSKTLTASDTSTHGGFSVLKQHADECLPPLDMSQQIPSQDLIAKDLHGVEWPFRHIYRGQPKRNLLTSGWSTFVSAKKLVAGDSFIFLRGENGELRVGVRRATKLCNNASPTVLSVQSMQLGVLATASHAISTGTMFSVYYRPRISPYEFIVSYDQYMKSVAQKYSLGMRFRMRFEVKECREQRLSGTIVGIEDVDQLKWPGSKWRLLKVKWDDDSMTVGHLDRVSPWNIEPKEVPSIRHPLVLPRPKRERAHLSSFPESYHLVTDGLSHSPSVPIPPQRKSRIFQSQEFKDKVDHESGNKQRLLFPHHTPTNSNWSHKAQNGFENQSDLMMHEQCFQHNGSMVPLSSGVPHDPGPSNCWAPPLSSYSSKVDVGSIENWMAPAPSVAGVAPMTPQNGNGTCMLFGVNLVKSPKEPMPPRVVNCDIQLLEISKITEPYDTNGWDSLPEKLCKHCCSVTTRTCTKVHKFGTALGRSVNLTKFNGYVELICELDQMFDFEGKLMDSSNGWHVIYTDNEGDTMLIGDCPWPEFQSMVGKMLILPKEEVSKLDPGCSFPKKKKLVSLNECPPKPTAL